MLFNTSINDLYVASELLVDVGYRRGESKESAACARVAEWLRFVAEQREEYEARKRAEKSRYPSLKSSMQTIWRARQKQAALAEN